MAAIKVTDMGQWDGEYDLGDNDRSFNGREWHWIKSISGYMPGTFADGLAGLDPDLNIAMAVIAMCRSGKIRREQAMRVSEDLMEFPYTLESIQWVGLDEEDEELPPALESGNEEPSPNGSLSNDATKTQNENSSGLTSENGSAKSADTLEPSTT